MKWTPDFKGDTLPLSQPTRIRLALIASLTLHLTMVVIILKVEQKIGCVDVGPGEVTSILGR